MVSWYPISAFPPPPQCVTVPVKLSGENWEMYGEVRRHPRLSKNGRTSWWWYAITPSGRIVELAAVGVEGGHHCPRYFAPLEPDKWLWRLPSPIETLSPMSLEPRPSAAEPEDGTEGGDGWPYPRLRLGCLTPPESLRECEARLLRSIRTEGSEAVRGLDKPSPWSKDLPREGLIFAMREAFAERMTDKDEKEYEAHEAVRSGWTPTRRDLTDWDYASKWALDFDRRERIVFNLRAADPQFSYYVIGEFVLKLSPSRTSQIYQEALERAYRRAAR